MEKKHKTKYKEVVCKLCGLKGHSEYSCINEVDLLCWICGDKWHSTEDCPFAKMKVYLCYGEPADGDPFDEYKVDLRENVITRTEYDDGFAFSDFTILKKAIYEIGRRKTIIDLNRPVTINPLLLPTMTAGNKSKYSDEEQLDAIADYYWLNKYSRISMEDFLFCKFGGVPKNPEVSVKAFQSWITKFKKSGIDIDTIINSKYEQSGKSSK